MKILDSFFRGASGKYVIFQVPNVPAILTGAAFIVWRVWPQTALGRWAAFVCGASTFLWAYLEIQSGASWFRRVLGAVVMIGLLLLVAISVV